MVKGFFMLPSIKLNLVIVKQNNVKRQATEKIFDKV